MSCDGKQLCKVGNSRRNPSFSSVTIGHIHAALAATQNRAKGNQKNFLKIMPPRLASAWILNPRKTIAKPVHASHQMLLLELLDESQSLSRATKVRIRFPWVISAILLKSIFTHDSVGILRCIIAFW